ncbi:MAG TPA: 1-(5-phosphoribosyl)-5-[(5-phosphoribosylamino)methylideneamino]imidazole-4-carboxamide isomerase [Candidatus Sulfotelmatobacter sp.]|jgi:phosphoribosylformimino-5-aminoimidazole carboxamide ribotide isomerase|nr:1-(5-phosphoribosyl)-5-[(5-phosphoribosylamino)methylideneamino]imidazole-4-carboxamide isomerase [Candidatus Sulfotelmatobacter sp.]
MVIIPAIDIKNGKCVRLTQGDFNREVIYEDDPVIVAKRFEKEGASIIHIVDLDGAKEGKLVNLDVVAKLINSVAVPVQIGGGIRDEQTVKILFSLGAKRIILGTLALENREDLQKILTKYADRIVVSLDSKSGKLLQKGWKEETSKNYIVTALELQTAGVKRFIYTDTIKDGMLSSPNFTEIKQLMQQTISPIIVGGGISSLEDIKKLKLLRVEGVIIGKALYENKFTLKEVMHVG